MPRHRPQDPPLGNIDTGLQVLKGQSIEVAASFLGDPDNYVEIPNSKIFTWVNIENVNLTLPNTPTGYSTSRSGGYPGGGGYVGLRMVGSSLSIYVERLTSKKREI